VKETTVPTTLKTCAAVVTAALLGLAACGDDDEPDARPDADDGTEAEAEPAGSSGDSDSGDGSDTDAYCAATLALETAPPPDVDFATATPEQLTAAMKAYASDVMRPLADEVIATAPAELDDEIQVLDAALDEMAATGEDAFETPEVSAAADAAHAYDLATCGWETVDVTATDYAFDGVPEELPAGPTSFELTNDAEEVHELLLLRKEDGVTQSVEELLAMPEEEAMALATVVGVPALATPGSSAYTVADLAPGDYIAICFIPTGMTATDGPPPEGPPHAVHGMHAELSVS
jgi:hypothetical protein